MKLQRTLEMCQSLSHWQLEEQQTRFVISGLRRGVNEIFTLLDVTQHGLVFIYGRFGATYRSQLQGSRTA